MAASEHYIRRIVDGQLDEFMAALPAIVIEGPKAVGKTATGLQRARTVRRLDDPAQRAVAEADPALLLDGAPPVLLDEWQHVPQSWNAVRRSVDEASPPPGSYLLTGSALPLGVGTHSGAGRMVTVRMRPLSLAERAVAEPTVSVRELLSGARPPIAGETDVHLEQYVAEILRSGFPGLRALDDERALRAQLDGYIERIIDRDFPELGHQLRNPAALRRWLTAYAAATATSTSFEKIRDAATAGHERPPAKSTVIPYRDVLQRLWVLDPVEAWLPTRNELSAMAQAPKHHLADPALAARLLNVGAGRLLDGATTELIPGDGLVLGALFESLVTLSVRVYAQAAEAEVKHLREAKGRHEIDLVLQRDDGGILAVEIKLSRTVDEADLRHLKWLADRIGPDLVDSIVITTGPAAYRRTDGIGVVPAALLGP